MSAETEAIKEDPAASAAELTKQQQAEYEAHVDAAIAEGEAQIKAGKGIPADQVWKNLGIE